MRRTIRPTIPTALAHRSQDLLHRGHVATPAVGLGAEGAASRGGEIVVTCPTVLGRAAPVALDDGTLLFVDAGVLRAVDRNLKEQTLATLLNVPARECWRFRADISLDGSLLEIEIRERSDDMPIEYTHHRWLLELARSPLRRQQRPE